MVICTTGGAAPELGLAPEPAQAAVAALATSVIVEYPEVRCVRIDLDPAAPAPAPQELLGRAAAVPGSGHLAARNGRWYEARLAEHDVADTPAAPPPVRGDASYLITGGLGGLGLAVARWLADHGARTLALVGRTIPAELPEVAALRAAGVTVWVRQADVSDPAAVAAVIKEARRELPPLRGVVHSAGVTADAAFEHLDAAGFDEVFGAKVRGAWHLHRHTAGADLDFFVLFSSMAAVLGSPGQANYMAANAFLDALAVYRQAHGEPALSVSWGPWAETGMAERSRLLPALAARGLDALPSDQALDGLGQLLARPASHAGLASVDWQRAAGRRAHPYTFVTDLVITPAGETEASARKRAAEIAALVLTDPTAARDALLEDLFGRVASALAIPASDRDQVRLAFPGIRLSELGLDSLTTIQLRTQLRANFGVDVPPEYLFAEKVSDIVDLTCRQMTLRTIVAGNDDAAEDQETEVLTI